MSTQEQDIRPSLTPPPSVADGDILSGGLMSKIPDILSGGLTPKQSDASTAWNLDQSASKVKDWYRQQFNEDLPIHVYGLDAGHKAMGFKYHDAVDVGLAPSSPRGRALKSYLQSEGMPFSAWDGPAKNKAGQVISTGTHFHIGPPGSRTRTGPIAQPDSILSGGLVAKQASAVLSEPDVLPAPANQGGTIRPRTVTQQPKSYDTPLSSQEEAAFQQWKQQYAPNDTGEDYDLRGAFKAGLTPDPKTSHWPDTFKKPNHPTFSNESQYATGPDAAKAGRWEGDKFVPPLATAQPNDMEFGGMSPAEKMAYTRAQNTPNAIDNFSRIAMASMAAQRQQAARRAALQQKVAQARTAMAKTNPLGNVTAGAKGESTLVPGMGGPPVLQTPHVVARQAAQSRQTKAEQQFNQIISEEQNRTVLPGDPSLEERIATRTGQRVLTVRDQVRRQLKNEGTLGRIETWMADPFGPFTKSREQMTEEDINRRVDAIAQAGTPEMLAERKDWGTQPAGLRAVLQPAARAGAGLIRTIAGLSAFGGLAPNEGSDYLNERAQFLEQGTINSPLTPEGKEIVRGLPEKGVAAALDLGFTVTEIIALKKATGLPLGQLLAAETVLKTNNLPASERAPKVALAYLNGKVLDTELSRPASAAIFGGPTAIQSGLSVAQGHMTVADALLQTGVQAGAGAILGGGGARELSRGALEYTVKSPLTPEPVRDVVANVMDYGKGLVKSEDGRNLSLYVDKDTGRVFGNELTPDQAKNYDPSIVTGEKRPVRNTNTVSGTEYDQLARALNIETKTPAKQIEGPQVETAVEKNVTPLAQRGRDEAQINRATDQEDASAGSGAPRNAAGIQEPNANQPNVLRARSGQGDVEPTVWVAPEAVASAADISEPVRHVDLQPRTPEGQFDEETPAQAEARRQQVASSAVPQPDLSTQASQSGASIPFMVTRSMRARLRERGYSESDINRMSPRQANNMLASPAIPDANFTPQGAAGVAVTGFTTAKGSTYTVEGDTTTRFKKATGKQYGASGQTIYVNPQTAMDVQSAMQATSFETGTPNGAILRNEKDGQLYAVDRAKDGTIVGTPTLLKYETTPQVGLHPIEIGGKVGIHVGHPITEVRQASGAVSEVAPMPERTIEQRFPKGSQVEYAKPGETSRRGGEVAGQGEVVGYRRDPTTGDIFVEVKTPSGRSEFVGDVNNVRMAQPDIPDATNLPTVPPVGAVSEVAPMPEPIEAFHGTRKGFDSFAIPEGDTKSPRGLGAWFSAKSDSPAYEEGNAEYTAEVFAGEKSSGQFPEGANVRKVRLSIKNPKEFEDYDDLREAMVGKTAKQYRAELQAEGHDGIVIRGSTTDGGQYRDDWIAFDSNQAQPFSAAQLAPPVPEGKPSEGVEPPEQAKSAQGASEPPNPFNTIPEGQKARSLPKTFAAAEMETGENFHYAPESIKDGVTLGKQLVADKGVDGAIEFVKTGDGIEWASTGYEVLSKLRDEEASLRADNSEAADLVAQKRLEFLNDFTEGATKRGQSSAGIRAIEEFAPDRAVYVFNRTAMKRRGRGLSQDEEARVAARGQETVDRLDRDKALSDALAEIARLKARKAKSSSGIAKPRAPKTDYQSKLNEQSAAILEALKPKIGQFEFGSLTPEASRFSGQAGKIGADIGKLPGDAEALAQYAAGQLGALNTVAELNAHMIKEFGAEIEPHLSAIRQRAFQVRADARVAEIETRDTLPERRRTILQEIQTEIRDAGAEKKAWERYVELGKRTEVIRTRQVERAQRQAETSVQKQERLSREKADRSVARQVEQEEARRKQLEDRTAQALRSQEGQRFDREQRKKARESAKDAWRGEAAAKNRLAADARQRLKDARREYQEASEAETKGYRASIAAQKEAKRTAALWDTPIRTAATEARTRLVAATNAKDPEVMGDLISVAAEKLLPEKPGGAPRAGPIPPAKFYVEMKDEFPSLVSNKNKGKIYKQARLRIQDMTKAAREAAAMRNAGAEAQRFWDKEGVDIDAQGVLIQKAENQRLLNEVRRQQTAELTRVSRGPIRRVASEIENIPRALQTTLNMHQGRQGLFYIMTHPLKVTARAGIPGTFKGYGALRRATYRERVSELMQHPSAQRFKRLGGNISELPGTTEDARVAVEEDELQSTVAMNLPWVRLSNQGFALGMNSERIEGAHILYGIGDALGLTERADPKFYRQATEFVNTVTGRTTMGKKMNALASLSNHLFYATRLNMSRVRTINDLFNPLKYLPADWNPADRSSGGRSDGTGWNDSYHEKLRWPIMKEAIKVTMVISALAAAAKILLHKELDNPEDPDEFKLVFGHTHYDISGGIGTDIRFAYHMIKTAALEATGHKVSENQQLLLSADRFLRQKYGPWPSAIRDWFEGKNAVGEPANFKVDVHHKMDTAEQNIIVRMLFPIVAHDFIKGFSDDGWTGGAKELPVLAGFGAQTYVPKHQKPEALIPKEPTIPAAVKDKVDKEFKRLDIKTGTVQGSVDLLTELEQKDAVRKIMESDKVDRKAATELLREKNLLPQDELDRFNQSYQENLYRLANQLITNDQFYSRLKDFEKEDRLDRVKKIARTIARREIKTELRTK